MKRTKKYVRKVVCIVNRSGSNPAKYQHVDNLVTFWAFVKRQFPDVRSVWIYEKGTGRYLGYMSHESPPRSKMFV